MHLFMTKRNGITLLFMKSLVVYGCVRVFFFTIGLQIQKKGGKHFYVTNQKIKLFALTNAS